MKTLVILCVSVIGIFGQFTDKTRTPGEKGSDVVEAVVNLIKNSCIFPNDRMYLRRLAYVETADGLSLNTYRPGYYGGIWQVGLAFIFWFYLINGHVKRNLEYPVYLLWNFNQIDPCMYI